MAASVWAPDLEPGEPRSEKAPGLTSGATRQDYFDVLRCPEFWTRGSVTGSVLGATQTP